MERPRLLADVAVRGESVHLLGPAGGALLRGETAAALLPLLDGRHGTAEIQAALGAPGLTVLDRLTEAGFVADGAATGWEPFGVPSDVARLRLATTGVEVRALGSTDPAAVLAALAESGVRASAGGQLVLVLAGNYLDERLGTLDLGGRPWLLAKPSGREAYVGPWFGPGGACWECLRRSMVPNLPVEAGIGPTDRAAGIPWLAGLVAQLAAGAVGARVALGEPAGWTDGTLLSIDARTLLVERHPVLRRPQCPACGDPALLARPPRIALRADPAPRGGRVASRDAGGTGRRLDPAGDVSGERAAATYGRLERHVSRLTGAVSRLASVDGVLPTWVARSSVPLPTGDPVGDARRQARGVAGGTGPTDLDARVRALCESLERWCGRWDLGRPTRIAAHADLADEEAVGLGELLHFSPAQYARRAEWNRGCSPREVVPEPVDPDRPIAWTRAWSLTEERVRFVPAGYAWYDHPDGISADSNGCAAGDRIEDAVLRGFCELVERDATALWWYSRSRRPGIDLSHAADPYVLRVLDVCARHGREVWALDLTTDLGVPTCAVLSRRRGEAAEDVVFGFGSALDPATALSRAAAEMAQALPAVLRRDAGGRTRYAPDDPRTVAWMTQVRIADQPWLAPHGTAEWGTPGPTDWITAAAARGLDVLVVDQSQPHIDLAVARVIAPGLRHTWRRLGPGRLFDVPVELGWTAAFSEEDCNPLELLG